jgi:hypothetical protein
MSPSVLNTVTPIRTATNTAFAPVSVGGEPFAFVVTPHGQERRQHHLSLGDSHPRRHQQPLLAIPVGNGPARVVITPTEGPPTPSMQPPGGHAFRRLARNDAIVEEAMNLNPERDAIVEDESSMHVNAEKIQALHKLKAIGPEFAAVLVGEIFHRDFANRRQLASYVGFAPSPFQSGNVAHDQGISKAGNPRGEPHWRNALHAGWSRV